MTANPLKVGVALAERTDASQPVRAEVTVTNVSGGPLLLNRRLLANFPTSEGELYFEITGPKGRKHDFLALVTPRDVKDEDFVSVEPGASIAKSVDLTRYYGVSKPGVYELTATYRNEVEYSRGGQSAWLGEVSSERLELMVD